MSRLIDADALKNTLSIRKMSELYPQWQLMPYYERESILRLANHFRRAIDEAPTIDAEMDAEPECDTCKIELGGGNE